MSSSAREITVRLILIWKFMYFKIKILLHNYYFTIRKFKNISLYELFSEKTVLPFRDRTKNIPIANTNYLQNEPLRSINYVIRQ
jgi:hypothetical protein